MIDTSRMTQEMIDNIPDEQDLIADFKYCYGKWFAANQAFHTPLPATSASGEPVIHGSRLYMDSIADYWKTRMHAAGAIMPYKTLTQLSIEMEEKYNVE